MSCEFNNNWSGNQLSSSKTASLNCGGLCFNTKGCTHYVWNFYNNGTCWLKTGSVTTANAILASDPNGICGIIISSSTQSPQTNDNINWNGNNWAMNCDFNNNGPNTKLKDVLTSGSNCGGLCYQASGCTHFAWSLYNGGTCFMKKGTITKSNAILISNPNTVCGVII